MNVNHTPGSRTIHVARKGSFSSTCCGRIVGTPGGKIYPGVEAHPFEWFRRHQFPEYVAPRLCLRCRLISNVWGPCVLCEGKEPNPSVAFILQRGLLDASPTRVCKSCRDKYIGKGWIPAENLPSPLAIVAGCRSISPVSSTSPDQPKS